MTNYISDDDHQLDQIMKDIVEDLSTVPIPAHLRGDADDEEDLEEIDDPEDNEMDDVEDDKETKEGDKPAGNEEDGWVPIPGLPGI